MQLLQEYIIDQRGYLIYLIRISDCYETMKNNKANQKIPMSIISTQIPEEIADTIKAKAKSMEVTPSWLVRKIIKSYIMQPQPLNHKELLNHKEIKKIEDSKHISQF